MIEQDKLSTRFSLFTDKELATLLDLLNSGYNSPSHLDDYSNIEHYAYNLYEEARREQNIRIYRNVKNKMKKVYYLPDRKDLAVGDNEALKEAEKLLTEDYLYTSNKTVITGIRLLVKKGAIDHNNIKIYFEGQEMNFYKNGRLDNWKNGFCDQERNMLISLLE